MNETMTMIEIPTTEGLITITGDRGNAYMARDKMIAIVQKAEKKMDHMRIKVEKQYHTYLRGPTQQEIFNKIRVFIEIPQENTYIIRLRGNLDQFILAIDRMVKRISSTSEPHTMTISEGLYSVEAVSVVKARDRRKEENERKKRQMREILKEKQGRWE